MIEAWRARGIERNKLLEGLMYEVYRLEDRKSENRMFRTLWLVDILVEYLCLLETGLEITRDFTVTGKIEAEDLFRKVFLRRIKSFARAEAEVNFLLAELLKRVLNLALMPIQSAIMALEIQNPQLIFGADSSMTQQELPDGP